MCPIVYTQDDLCKYPYISKVRFFEITCIQLMIFLVLPNAAHFVNRVRSYTHFFVSQLSCIL